MAKHETLGSLFTDIADQLREKGDFDVFSWVTAAAPFEMASVCYGNGKFVAVNGSSASYSTDGVSWTETNLSESINLFAVCYGNGKFVAVGGNSAAYSTDGVNWTEVDTPQYSPLRSVCYGNDRFVAVGATRKTIYSLDGLTWIGEDSFSADNVTLHSVCYGDGKFVAVGDGVIYGASASGSFSQTIRITQHSTDGISWTKKEVLSSIKWKSVCYGSGLFAAATSEGVFTSYDAENWMGWNTGAAKAICYGDGKFVAVTDAGRIVHSEDGSIWKKDSRVLDDSALGGISAIVFGAEKFVVVGDQLVGYGKAGIIADSFPDVIAELSPLNIAYGATPPSDTAKLWVPLEAKPASVEVSLDSLPSAVDELTTKAAVLSVAVSYPSAAEVGGKIYIFGGTPAAGATLIQEYDPAADTIATKTAVLPLNLYGAAAVAINEKIYIFGGVSYKTSIYEYDPATDTLTQKESVLADGVSYPAAVAIGGKAYIFGGQTASSAYTTLIQEYDPATDTCVKMAAVLESTNYGAAAVAINGKAYIFGGRNYSTAIQEYDPATDTIITKDCVLLDGVLNATAAAINGKAYIFGGQTGASVYTDWIQEYDPMLDAIVQKAAVLPEPVGRAAMVEVGGKAYLIGGYADGSYVSTILEYTARESLTENHLKIFATGAAGESGQVVRLVNWPGSSLKMQVFSTYLGDVDGYAAAQEAYIYDTEAAAWKSLSGSVYTR